MKGWSVAHLADEDVLAENLESESGDQQVNQKADYRASSDERTVCAKGLRQR